MITPRSLWRGFWAMLVFVCGSSMAFSQELVVPQQRMTELDRTFLISQCPAEQGLERDQCLVSLAFNNNDPGMCDADPESGCRQLAAQAGVERCGMELSGAERYGCELSILVTYPAPEACSQTLDPMNCYGTVAAGRGDPDIVTEWMQPGEDRDAALSLYVTMTGDAAALSLIDDPFIHDGTIALSIGSIGSVETGISPDHCDGMRGNYPPERDDDIDLKTITTMCRSNVEWLNALADERALIEGEDNQDQFVEDAIAARMEWMEAIQSGQIDLYDVFPELDDGFEEFAEGADVEINQEVMDILAEVSAENLPTPAAPVEGCSSQAWAGHWCTNYYGMDLTADEWGFLGHYEWDNGSIEGTLDPSTCTARGQWFEDPNSRDTDWGHFEFTLDPSTETWTGIWGYNTKPLGGDWHGERCTSE